MWKAQKEFATKLAQYVFVTIDVTTRPWLEHPKILRRSCPNHKLTLKKSVQCEVRKSSILAEDEGDKDPVNLRWNDEEIGFWIEGLYKTNL